ncbi:hypothetical protein [Clostridium facile]|uniref:Uncharacterized protein n=1 Tax=Clostridium facile TaxID=2763035 RepID=A0ABR7INS9_9CLOT|nr:hypothetical protein [Clostridium facile]MBC5786767.1 hypothetical protein [Clostridium facile]
MKLTEETRNASYRKLNPASRRAIILQTLGNGEMTSREIATKLGYTDMNAVRPRITELMQMGKIIVCGSTFDPVTGRAVAVYRRIKNVK